MPRLLYWDCMHTGHTSFTSLLGLQAKRPCFLYEDWQIENRDNDLFTPSVKLLHSLYWDWRPHLLDWNDMFREQKPRLLHSFTGTGIGAMLPLFIFFTGPVDTEWPRSYMHRGHAHFRFRVHRPRPLPFISETLCVFLSHMVKTNRQSEIWHSHTLWAQLCVRVRMCVCVCAAKIQNGNIWYMRELENGARCCDSVRVNHVAGGQIRARSRFVNLN